MPTVKRGESLRYEAPENHLTHSKMRSWNACRYSYDLQNTRHIVPRGALRALDLGSAVHAGITAGVHQWVKREVWNQRNWNRIIRAANKNIQMYIDTAIKDRGGTLNEEQQLEFEEISESAKIITRRSLRQIKLKEWKTVVHPETGEILCEHSLTTSLPNNCGWEGFHGTPDWVAMHIPTGRVWVIDFKVVASFGNEDEEEVNSQFPCYQKMLWDVGVETIGSILWQIRAKVPSKPKLNQNGSMSRARIATTWHFYKKALIEAKLDPADYKEEMESKLDVEFFKPLKYHRDRAMVEWFWQAVVEPCAFSMAREEGHVFRQMQKFGCKMCRVREYCLAELNDDDTDWLLKTSYIDLDNPYKRVILSPDDLDFDEG